MTQSLDELFSSRQLKRDADTLANWGVDWTRSETPAPSAVVFVESLDEVVALVRLANEEGFALVPSGGRTGLSGGAVAAHGEVVVSFDRMNRILEFDAADRLVRCQAGVLTQTLQEYAGEQGLFYPVDFASAGSSRIGGNIATNAGGIRVIRYGLTRDWVAGLTVVTGAGEVLDCNRGLVKNATGYDLRHLFIGSEGTLGLVVEAEMRLARMPPPQRVMVLGVPVFAELIDVLRVFQERLTLSAFEFFSEAALERVLAHRNLKRPMAEPSPFYALLEFDEVAVEVAMVLFQKVVEEGWVSDGVLSQSDTQAAGLWQLREGISESIAACSPYKNDLSVRISRMPGFIEEVDALVRESYPDFEVCWYGHIGDGNLHLNILKPDHVSLTAFQAICHAMSPKIFAAVRKRGGSISAEHGVGLTKRDFLSFTRSEEDIRLMARLKAVFDPKRVMNPGKLLPA